MTENIKPGGIPVNWFVFPIREGAKDPPLVKRNLDENASNDPRRIAEWRKQHPRCNWGVALRKSNILAVDVDRKTGQRGGLTFAELDFEHGFPPTYTVRTPSGGWHLYYRGRHVFGLGVHGFGAGVDSPNYVVLPGSRLVPPDGDGIYRVIRNRPLAPAPSWFYEVLGEHKRASVEQIPVVDLDQPRHIAWAIDYLKNGAPVSRQGAGGEKTLFDVACVLKDFAISEWQAGQLIIEHYNDAKCDPPWSVGGAPADDLTIKIHNAYSYGTENAPGAATAEAQFAADPESPEATAALAKHWQKFDRARAKRRSVTKIDGIAFPVVRTPPRKRKAGK